MTEPAIATAGFRTLLASPVPRLAPLRATLNDVPPSIVIELDTAPASWPRPEHRRPRWQRLRIALVLMGLLGSLTSDLRPLSLEPMTRLPGLGVGDIRIHGNFVYLVRRSDAAQAFVESYQIPTGIKRWAEPVPPATHITAIDDERLVLATQEPTDPPTAALVGLDITTGTQAWRRTGYIPAIYGATGPSAVLVAEASQPDGEPQTQPRTSSPNLSGIDMHAGTVRWSLDTAPGTARQLVLAGIANVEVAELSPDGALRIRSAESAEIVRTAKLDHPGEVDGFDISGNRLLAYHLGPDRHQSNAVFDLVSGRRLWQRTDEPDGTSIRFCKPVLCAGTRRDIAALEPDTGRELWHLNGWTGLTPLDDHQMLATRPHTEGDVAQLDTAVVDTATGRIGLLTNTWSPALRTGAGVLIVSRGPGQSLIARLDAHTGAVQVVGRAEHISAAPQCIATRTLLVCQSDNVSIWRLRPMGTGLDATPANR
ncbi:hypothetical protein ACQP2P_16265 [Dactylosporangium sp. CA-139114]|uniref:hypothetical protein n=1 Tax=Dactylosporangium sp. CA-139114 TaxID=3239931 RepID=UPI003D99ECF1